jgi:broad specificity phosphatase PhoE
MSARYRDGPVPSPEAPTQLVLVRHGESVSNVDSTIGGPRTCEGLSALGREQCIRLAARLRRTRELEGAVLYASQYRRAQETARLVGPAFTDVAPLIEARFGELDPGPQIDGMAFEAFVEHYGMPDFLGDPAVPIFPGGESVAAMSERVVQAMDDVVAAHPGQIVVVCTHGGVVEAAMRHVVGAPLRGRFALWTTNASLTVLFRMGSEREPWRIGRYNDAAHLLDRPAG